MSNTCFMIDMRPASSLKQAKEYGHDLYNEARAFLLTVAFNAQNGIHDPKLRFWEEATSDICDVIAASPLSVETLDACLTDQKLLHVQIRKDPAKGPHSLYKDGRWMRYLTGVGLLWRKEVGYDDK